MPVNHPPSGASTIFGEPVAQVHALLPDPPSTTRHKDGQSQGILAMLERRRERHAAALAAFATHREGAEQALQVIVAAASAQATAALQAGLESIEADMAALGRDRIMLLDEAKLLAVRLL